MAEPAQPRSPAAALVAAGTFAFHCATNGAYGFFRDELYFIACGRHPAAGYVDQPPLTPLVAAASAAISGEHAALFRLLPALAHALTVWLTGRLALRLGGGAFAATLAALAAAVSPVLLAGGHLFTMNAFEPPLWLGVALCVTRALQADHSNINERSFINRALLCAGALVGVGLENKYSMAFFVGALLVAVLISAQRRILVSRGMLLGVGVAALIALPNVWWQASRGWPMLELLRNGQLYKNAPFELREFLAGQILQMSPLSAPLWLGGIFWLTFSRDARRVQALGFAFPIFLALLIDLKAKAYYAAPAYPMLLAAGGVAFERLLRPAFARVATASIVALGGLAIAPIVVPVLPPEAAVRWQEALRIKPPRLERMRQSPLAQHLADEFGWPELAASVAQVFASLPAGERAHAALFTMNYGEAGALDFFGRKLGLPPAFSGHNNYWLWGPPRGATIVVIVGGDFSDHSASCGSLERHTGPTSPWAMPYESGLNIFVCRSLTRPIEELWPAARHYE